MVAPTPSLHMNHNETVLEGSPNFRDLGGYTTDNGQMVRYGKVFRSGHLAKLTDADVEQLVALGLNTVVDFRPNTEQDMFGIDRLPAETTYISIPIGDATMAPAMHLALQNGDYTALHDLADANRKLIRDYTTQFGEVLRLIADPASHPIAFHCIGGKDRTGIAAALLLFTLGVPWDDVRRDYLRSNNRLQGAVEDQIAGLTGSPDAPARPRPTEENLAALRRFFIVESSYIDAGRDEAERLAGSLEQYIRDHLGVSNELQASLRTTLLEPKTA